ncbi:MAG: MFS transporter [Planctomycetaceae bacterium]|nr:MFS transporter [Planctomycetaceae bacterium]
MTENTPYSIEDQPLNFDQRVWRWKVLTSTYFAYAGFYLVRKVFPLCKTTLADEYGIGFDGVANIWTAYLFGYMVGQFINSFIGRKWGPRALLLGGLGISIVINVIFGFANSYSTFLVFMLFNGLVQAAGWPGSVGGVAEWLRRKERGTIMGIWSTNYLVGNIVVKLLGGFLLLHYTTKYDGHYGVRYAFFGCTVLAFAIWWLIFFWQRSKPEDVGLDPIVDHEHPADRAIVASTEEHVGFKEYSALLLNPIVPLMGLAYFSIKFLRYALDSWLPTFLDLQGMDVGEAAYYSSIFDWTGLAGAIIAGIALDWIFRSRWELICLLMGIGMVAGYIAVLQYGTNPIVLAICFGLVGFMLYGPDTLLCGAGAVAVAGQRNAVAVAGLVNGIGSIGPVLQEQINGRILQANTPEIAVRNSNLLGLSMSILFVASMLVICIWVVIARRHTHRGLSEQSE